MALLRLYSENSWRLLEGEREVLKVSCRREGNTMLLSLKGSMRSDTELFIRDELIALATLDMAAVLDCEGLSYISNSCQIALLSVQRQMDRLHRGSLCLRKLPEEIYADFVKTNLHELLMIE